VTFSLSYSHPGPTRLAITGSLDARTAGLLKATLDSIANQQPAHLEVDLSALEWIDSVGVGALIGLYKRLAAQGNVMRIVGLSQQPVAIFRLLRLERVMTGG
jgi:anti-sigma B factor antagonist